MSRINILNRHTHIQENTMDLQRICSEVVPEPSHRVVLLLILLSQWAVEYASGDLPFPLLMLIVIDISCTQHTRFGPSAVDQKTTKH